MMSAAAVPVGSYPAVSRAANVDGSGSDLARRPGWTAGQRASVPVAACVRGTCPAALLELPPSFQAPGVGEKAQIEIAPFFDCSLEVSAISGYSVSTAALTVLGGFHKNIDLETAARSVGIVIAGGSGVGGINGQRAQGRTIGQGAEVDRHPAGAVYVAQR